MSDEAALLAAIQAAPADDAPRLVYADWLDENGRSDQAEAIRAEYTLRLARARWADVRARVDSSWIEKVFPAGVLVLRYIAPGRMISAIKTIRAVTGLGLAESKAMAESVPVRMLEGRTLDVLRAAQDRFLRAGFGTEITDFPEPGLG